MKLDNKIRNALPNVEFNLRAGRFILLTMLFPCLGFSQDKKHSDDFLAICYHNEKINLSEAIIFKGDSALILGKMNASCDYWLSVSLESLFSDFAAKKQVSAFSRGQNGLIVIFKTMKDPISGLTIEYHYKLTKMSDICYQVEISTSTKDGKFTDGTGPPNRTYCLVE